MKQSKTVSKPARRRHAEEYKQEALNLAERVGMAKAATQLGLATSQLYNWRSKAFGKLTQADREQKLATENVRLKRRLAEQEEELAIVKKAAQYFARELG
jgi:transposase